MKNFVGLVLGPLVAGLVVQLPVGIVLAIQFGLQSLAGEIDVDVLQIMMLGMSGVVGIVLMIAVAFIQGGIADVMLRTVRGEKATIGQFFGGGRFMGKMLLGQIVLGFAVTIGVLLCVVPGYILLIGTSLWTFFIVDKNMGSVDALKASWEMTNGQKVSIFVLMLLQGLCIIAGYLACGLGVLVAAPMIGVSNAYVYAKLSGQEPRLPA